MSDLTFWPGLIVSGLTLLVLGMQWLVFRRQATLMERQGVIMADQQATLAEQMRWRRDEAIGTFYRLAHDLVGEFWKANKLAGTPIPADFSTHPRQVLREASRTFAPLGNDFVYAANEIAMRLDLYFSAVEEYNRRPGGREGADQMTAVDALREQVGKNLDRASHLISDALRWKYGDGTDYNFAQLCSRPAVLRGES